MGVADQHRNVALCARARVVGERGLEARAERFGQPLELVHQSGDLPRAVEAHERPGAAVADGVHLGLIAAQQRDRTQAGGHPLRGANLGGSPTRIDRLRSTSSTIDSRPSSGPTLTTSCRRRA